VLSGSLERTVDYLDFNGKNFYHQLSMDIQPVPHELRGALPGAGYSVGEWSVTRDLRLDGIDLIQPMTARSHPAPIPDRSLLVGFIELETAAPDAILEFAQRWGTLAICEHDLPNSHAPHATRSSFDSPYCALRLEGGANGVLHEPLTAWRNLAGTFAAIARIATHVLDNNPAPVEDWERLFRARPVGVATHDEWFIPARDVTSDVPAEVYFDEIQREPLVVGLELILAMADLRPTIRWRRGHQRPEFDLLPGSLFAALVMELMYVVTGSDPMVHCSACGRLYEPTRQPRQGEHHYCPRCRREGKPQRYAEQRRAEKARRRKNRGESP
jgi:hypothetical protein